MAAKIHREIKAKTKQQKIVAGLERNRRLLDKFGLTQMMFDFSLFAYLEHPSSNTEIVLKSCSVEDEDVYVSKYPFVKNDTRRLEIL